MPPALRIDLLGVIKQVGEGNSTSDFKQGDEVYGQGWCHKRRFGNVCRNGFDKYRKYRT